MPEVITMKVRVMATEGGRWWSLWGLLGAGHISSWVLTWQFIQLCLFWVVLLLCVLCYNKMIAKI